MDLPNHTFVIPAFGDSVYLEDCIRSLKQQNVASKILITTSTPSAFLDEIAGKYRIEIRVNDGPGGLANDWNFALQQCTTKYFTLAHQDDIYFPDYTESFLRVAESHGNENSLILFSDYKELVNNELRSFSIILFFKKLMLIVFQLKHSISSTFLKKSLLVFGNPIACPTVMFNVQNIGAFGFSTDFQYNLDWEAWLRLAGKKGWFVLISRKLMAHRLHAESQTSKLVENKTRKLEEARILKSIWGKGFGGLIFFFYRISGGLNRVK